MTTEERDEERRDYRRRFNLLIAKVSAIPIPGWEYEPIQNHEEPSSGSWRLGSLVNSQISGHIYIHTDWHDHDKLLIGVQFPKDFQGKDHLGYGDKSPSIGISATKSAVQMAKDIINRLLPLYYPMLAKVLERNSSYEAHLMAKVANGQAIKAAIPSLTLRDTILGRDYRGMSQAGSEVTLWDMKQGLEVKVSDKTVDVHINGLTVEQAIELIKLAQSYKKEQEDEK